MVEAMWRDEAIPLAHAARDRGTAAAGAQEKWNRDWNWRAPGLDGVVGTSRSRFRLCRREGRRGVRGGLKTQGPSPSKQKAGTDVTGEYQLPVGLYVPIRTQSRKPGVRDANRGSRQAGGGPLLIFGLLGAAGIASNGRAVVCGKALPKFPNPQSPVPSPNLQAGRRRATEVWSCCGLCFDWSNMISPSRQANGGGEECVRGLRAPAPFRASSHPNPTTPAIAAGCRLVGCAGLHHEVQNRCWLLPLQCFALPTEYGVRSRYLGR